MKQDIIPKKEILEIEKVAEFPLTFRSNVDCLISAFSQCGYMTKTYGYPNGDFVVCVYKIIY